MTHSTLSQKEEEEKPLSCMQNTLVCQSQKAVSAVWIKTTDETRAKVKITSFYGTPAHNMPNINLSYNLTYVIHYSIKTKSGDKCTVKVRVSICSHLELCHIYNRKIVSTGGKK